MDRWFLGSRAAEDRAERPFRRGFASDPRVAEELSRLALERRELLRALARELSEDRRSAECVSAGDPDGEVAGGGGCLRGAGEPVLSCVQPDGPGGSPIPQDSPAGAAPSHAVGPSDRSPQSPRRVSQAAEAGSFSEGKGSDLREEPLLGDRAGAQNRGPGAPRRTLSEWILGPTVSSFLDRTIELRVSTLASLAVAFTTILFVFLLYSGLPARRESAFPGPPFPVEVSAESGSASAADSPEGGAAGDRPVAMDPGTQSAPSKESTPGGRTPPVRWSPALEIQPEEPATGRSGERSGGSGQAQGAEVAPRRTYAIQVRARESWEGAGRLLDYFRQLGYADVETEPEGKDAAGEALFTVFVGRYGNHEEARRACERLKEETRRRPYRYGRDCFQGSFVVTRTRS